MGTVRYEDNDGTFYIEYPDCVRGLYFPIAGEKGIKSSVSPVGGGDSKLDQNTFILEPVSIENLHNNRSSRNFWCRFEDGEYWSALGASAEAEKRRAERAPEKNSLTAGFMWQKTERENSSRKLRSTVLFLADDETNTEIMSIRLCNAGTEKCTFTPFAAVPLYGRSADNIRDHRHVTSLLHRIRTTEYGIEVTPTLSFDERGHQKNTMTYFVYGAGLGGQRPEGFFPTVDSYIGECGTFTSPEAVVREFNGVRCGVTAEGREAMGAMRFAPVTLEPGETADYSVFTGITERPDLTADVNPDLLLLPEKLMEKYGTFGKALIRQKMTAGLWNEKVNIRMKTADHDFDMLMRWVCFQPFLRRIYGCSFLPHHDYGRGGRGWRDLWQDCLALLIMDPSEVREMIISNFAGVRMDGTNATIIGDRPGEFRADRNGISRVWMDHGMWPLQTVKLYLDQTGDYSVLTEDTGYFKDGQVERGYAADEAYSAAQGTCQRTIQGEVYSGSVLEHLLIQNVTAVYDTGDHGIMKLRGADWNDALDMASENGESVAFTCAYADNLKILAETVLLMTDKCAGDRTDQEEYGIEIPEEFAELLEAAGRGEEDGAYKKYLTAVRHTVSGRRKKLNSRELADFLNEKADSIMSHIRGQEWVSVADKGEICSWYNSYYDNSGRQTDGENPAGIRMMLTGQVFAIMSGTATAEQIPEITKAADRFLYDRSIGGYRLNTDFHEEKYDMGRAFGFAFGEKENGAVFSHMAVMYAYALYKRGFAREGYKALQALADAAMDFETGRIYPGIPEYFNNEGRGLYSYLTGAGSWYALTMVTQVYGVRGRSGDLEISPKLLGCQFDEDGKAELECRFAGSELCIRFTNPGHLDPGCGRIVRCSLDGRVIYDEKSGTEKEKHSVLIPRDELKGNEKHNIELEIR